MTISFVFTKQNTVYLKSHQFEFYSCQHISKSLKRKNEQVMVINTDAVM